jgi:hypothetical protein
LSQRAKLTLLPEIKQAIRGRAAGARLWLNGILSCEQWLHYPQGWWMEGWRDRLKRARQSGGMAGISEGQGRPPQLLIVTNCTSFWPFKKGASLVKCWGRMETQRVWPDATPSMLRVTQSLVPAWEWHGSLFVWCVPTDRCPRLP